MQAAKWSNRWELARSIFWLLLFFVMMFQIFRWKWYATIALFGICVLQYATEAWLTRRYEKRMKMDTVPDPEWVPLEWPPPLAEGTIRDPKMVDIRIYEDRFGNHVVTACSGTKRTRVVMPTSTREPLTAEDTMLAVQALIAELYA